MRPADGGPPSSCARPCPAPGSIRAWSTSDSTRSLGATCWSRCARSASRCRRPAETTNFGNPWFRAGKRPFAIFGVRDGAPGVSFRADPFARELLLDDERYFPTPYMHHHGWLTLRLDEPIDWDEVLDLVLDSYRMQALKRMLGALDG